MYILKFLKVNIITICTLNQPYMSFWGNWNRKLKFCTHVSWIWSSVAEIPTPAQFLKDTASIPRYEYKSLDSLKKIKTKTLISQNILWEAARPHNDDLKKMSLNKHQHSKWGYWRHFSELSKLTVCSIELAGRLSEFKIFCFWRLFV